MALYECSYTYPLTTCEGLNGASIKLSARGFSGCREPTLKNMVLLEMYFMETRRIFSCSSDGVKTKVRLTELPTEERSVALTLDELMSQHQSREAICRALSDARLDRDWQEHLGRVVPQLAYKLVRKALAKGIGTLALKAEINMTSAVLEDHETLAHAGHEKKASENSEAMPLATCHVCLAEIWPRQEAKRMPCGHNYHSDCTPFYDERGISCMMCHYNIML